jgi:hypothetical protein
MQPVKRWAAGDIIREALLGIIQLVRGCFQVILQIPLLLFPCNTSTGRQ